MGRELHFARPAATGTVQSAPPPLLLVSIVLGSPSQLAGCVVLLTFQSHPFGEGLFQVPHTAVGRVSSEGTEGIRNSIRPKLFSQMNAN